LRGADGHQISLLNNWACEGYNGHCETIMTSPPPELEFIARYPVLAIPLAVAVCLILLRAGVRITRPLVYAIAAAPGLVILWALTYLWDLPPGLVGWFGFLQASILLIPTNTLAPVIMIAAAVSIVSNKVRKPPPSELTKLDAMVLGLIAVAYGYDQVIITGAQTP
jgi:hypothetical protein